MTKILGPCGREKSEHGLLECDTMQFGREEISVSKCQYLVLARIIKTLF
jgi:hypothetical protein